MKSSNVKTILTLLLFSSSIHSTTSQIQKRIVGGVSATFFYRKHLANLQVRTKANLSYGCTATIIAPTWLLSAAHCFSDSAGAIDIASTFAYIGIEAVNPWDEVPYTINKIYIHKNYIPLSFDIRHDIALINLSHAIDESSYFPVTLGKAPISGSLVIAAGYGVLNEARKMAKYAMQTDLIAQTFQTCTRFEDKDTVRGLDERVHVCATSLGFPDMGETDTCYGDSGGPLFHTNKFGNHTVQYGITSYSSTGCAAPGGTPWYVRVSFYQEVIKAFVSGRANVGFKQVI